MLEFNNLTEEQIDKLGLLPKGRYKGKVVKAERCVSKSGATQILLGVRVEDGDENPYIIPVYLSGNGKFMLRLLRHFCYATGLDKNYESKRLSPVDCENKECLVEIDVQVGKDKVDSYGVISGKWEDKNIITDFILDDKKQNTNSSPEFNDHIPF